MKKLLMLLLAVLVLCTGCGGDSKKVVDVKNVEPLKPIEVKNTKIEAVQDAKLKVIAKEIDANLKKNNAIAGFNKIKVSQNGTDVMVELQCDKSKTLTRKNVFEALSCTFKSIYKDANTKNASITLMDAGNSELCTLELDRETEKQINWSQADTKKDWNKIGFLAEYPAMKSLK